MKLSKNINFMKKNIKNKNREPTATTQSEGKSKAHMLYTPKSCALL